MYLFHLLFYYCVLMFTSSLSCFVCAYVSLVSAWDQSARVQ